MLRCSRYAPAGVVAALAAALCSAPSAAAQAPAAAQVSAAQVSAAAQADPAATISAGATPTFTALAFPSAAARGGPSCCPLPPRRGWSTP